MSYRTFYLSRSKDEGFAIRLIERSRFRDDIESVAGALCSLTGHRYCNSWFGKVSDWAYKAEKELQVILIDREIAHELVKDDPYFFFDEDDELDNKEDET